MTLHNAILQVLYEHGCPMTAIEIARELNRNKLYTKGNGSVIQSSQISARVKNYPLLFTKKNGLISPSGKVPKNTTTMKTPDKSTKQVVTQKIPFFNLRETLRNSSSGIEKKTLSKFNPLETLKNANTDQTPLSNKNLAGLIEGVFRLAGSIDNHVPSCPGLYCIRLAKGKSLPEPFQNELKERPHTIIYIGKASNCLRTRFLNQELRARGHGTFFRSIGAVLGFRPAPGSLIGKKNQKNYKFTLADELKIIEWINQNLEVNWLPTNSTISATEKHLIVKYRPLLNIADNPNPSRFISIVRSECVRIANSK